MNNKASVPPDDSVKESKMPMEIDLSPRPKFTPLRETLFVLSVCLAQFSTQASVGQTVTLVEAIGEHFQVTDPGEKSWFVAGFSLTVGTFIVFSGRLGDTFCYKRMLILGYIWFSIWSVVTGLAAYSKPALFNFARAMSGMGPALCLPNSIAVLGSTYPPGRKKSFLFALFGSMAPLGSLAGAAFAGIFDIAWWPWAYWSLGIELAILAAMAFCIIPTCPPTKSVTGMSLSQIFRKIDLVGAIVGVTALVLVNFSWNQAPIVGWQEPYIIVTLLLGCMFMVTFFTYEVKFASSPLIPFEVLDGNLAFVLSIVACGWSCFGVWYYYINQIVLVLQHGSPILAAAKTSPVAVSGPLAAFLTMVLLPRLGPSIVMFLALTGFMVGTVLIATMPLDQIYWGQMFASAIITPFGMDMSFPAATLILSNAFREEHQGIAASLVLTVVNYSISLGLGFAGTIEVHVNHGSQAPAAVEKGYRAALYFGTALAGLGMFLSVWLWVRSRGCLSVRQRSDQRKGTGRYHEEA